MLIFYNDSQHCPPVDATNDESARIVYKYLEDHPEELHKRNTFLIRNALLEAWPCPD